MITVGEVIQDPDFTAPEPYTVQRSTGVEALGGFQTTVTTFQLYGPVQQASNKEIAMLPEADRVGAVRSFWATVPLHTTSGTEAMPSVYGEVPQGITPGNTFTLTQAPPAETGSFYVNRLAQTPDIDYWVSGAVITTSVSVPALASLWFQWPITARVQAAGSDILVYGNEQYRVLSTYFDPGCGYFKALATRMAAA